MPSVNPPATPSPAPLPRTAVDRPAPPPHSGSMWALIAVLLLMGLPTAGGGLVLLVLGGSAYYLIAGLALCAVAWWVHRRSRLAYGAYAVFLLATLLWTLWEVGLDWWGMTARGDVFVVLGAVMLLPWLARQLPVIDPKPHRPRSAPLLPSAWDSQRSALAVTVGLWVTLALASWGVDPSAIDGVLPGARGGAELTDPVPAGEWHAYGRTGQGQRYAPLNAITPDNVDKLQVAWHFRTGDFRGRDGDPEETTFEVAPLKVGKLLYLCTPHQSVIALDATTGQEVWRFDPHIRSPLALQHLTCRGVSYWRRPGPEAAERDKARDTAPPAAASEGTEAQAASAALAASSASAATAPASAAAHPPVAPSGADTPAPSPTEAAAAQAPADSPVAEAAQAAQASTAVDLPIAAQGHATVADCPAKLFMPTADGRVIALDPLTGAVCQSFGGGTGQINLWTGMPNVKLGGYYSTSPVVVSSRVLVVGGTVLDNVSTKEPSGVVRGYDIDTGALLWNWDPLRPTDTRPLPAGQTYVESSPNVWSIMSVDEDLGMVYLPVGNAPPDQWGGRRSAEAEKVGSSVVALDLATGAQRWVFQTVHHDLWDYDVPAQPSLVDLEIDGLKVPALMQPTKQGELFVLDRRTGQPAHRVTELPAPQGAAKGDRTAPTQPKSAISFEPAQLTGASTWGVTPFDHLACRIAFHRLRYQGRFTPPSTEGSLIYPGNFGVFNWGGIAIDPTRQVAFTTPTYLAFTSQLIPRPDDKALMVQGGRLPQGSLPALNENIGAPFAVKMGPFLGPLGIPCQAPPWGLVAGVDLSTGQTVWQRRNGTVRDLSPVPVPFKMGVPSLGGPLVTAGGVAFLSGTLDNYLRAYDLSTGRELWRARLPAGGQATPVSYTGADGRQYVVVAAGGHGSLGTKAGDSVIAYALP